MGIEKVLTPFLMKDLQDAKSRIEEQLKSSVSDAEKKASVTATLRALMATRDNVGMHFTDYRGFGEYSGSVDGLTQEYQQYFNPT